MKYKRTQDDSSGRTTWAVLVALGQIKKRYTESPTIRVQQLTFWQPGTPNVQRLVAISQLAESLDRLYRSPLIGAARLAPRDKALHDLAEVLVIGTNTVSTIAETADRLYAFGANTYDSEKDFDAGEGGSQDH